MFENIVRVLGDINLQEERAPGRSSGQSAAAWAQQSPGDGRCRCSTNPTITPSLPTRQPSSRPRLRHAFNLFADITLKLWQKLYIESYIMKRACDKWLVSFSIDIFILRWCRCFSKLILRLVSYCKSGIINKNKPAKGGSDSRTDAFVPCLRIYI